MSPRRRLGVALVLGPPVADEVNGLRRALGDESLHRVPPHLTLVPPVNVQEASLPAALEALRRAAQSQRGPLVLAIGPVESFLPASPVLYLAVAGPALGDLSRLRGAISTGPLRKPGRWPWVPHITVRDGLPEHLAGTLLEALGRYRAEVSFDRLVLLEEKDRRWGAVADACFGPPAVVGRGGLELELTEGSMLGPDALALLAGAPALHDVGSCIVIGARREGRLIGIAQAWAAKAVGSPVQACVFVAEEERGRGFGRALLAALEASVHRRGWSPGPARAIGPAGFFAHCGSWARAEALRPF
jgi:2'-5' RNA ligase